MNMLDFNTKGETQYAIAILHTKNFRKSRSMTKEGRKLFNKELGLARKKAKQYNIILHKKLPRRFDY